MKGVLGVIEGVRGHTYDTIYDLFFAKESVIAAIVLHPSDLTHLYIRKGLGLSELSELVVGGALRKREAKARAGKMIEQRRLEFDGKSPDELLRTHKGNFSIRYSEVVSLEVKKDFFEAKLKFKILKSNGKRGKLQFSLRKEQFEDARRIVNYALPDKVV